MSHGARVLPHTRPETCGRGMPAPAEEAEERLGNELELLGAMYPECIAFENKSRELKYSPTAPGGDDGLNNKGVLVLRLPDTYPASGLPDLITAKDAKGQDARTLVSAVFSGMGVVEGEEVLDAYILAFQDFINESAGDEPDHQDEADAPGELEDRKQQQAQPRKTVVIWLHHLLNTNKRKLALGPSLDGASVSGLTRPGYPGVMVFSGPRDAVDSHVGELRAQRWQAFQVRYDSSEDGQGLAWEFEHGTEAGIREVESLGEMAQRISGAEHREMFLRVMGLK